MSKIKNMGTATMRFSEGLIVTGSAGTDTRSLIVTGSTVISGSDANPALEAYHNLSNQYVALINNDASTGGHGLKVTSDGTGAGTNIFDAESASTTLFRVRGDGRVGIGKVTSLPAAVLTVSSSNTDSDLAIAHKIHHIGDSDTFIMFDDDELHLAAGGRTFLKLEESTTDKLIVNHGGLDIDLQVKGENDANLIRTDAENDSIYFGASSGAGVDNNFFVSGSIGSKDTATRGTATFGGDTVISGALFIEGGSTYESGEQAAIILNSDTQSRIVWDTKVDGAYAPDAAIFEAAGDLYLSGSDDVRIRGEFGDVHVESGDDIQLKPGDLLQILENPNASGNFASFFAQPSAGVYRNVLDVGDTGVVINEDGLTDYDFRVETDGDSNMLFVDAGNNKVGISTGAPHSGFHIDTSVAFAARTITQDYTVTITDHTIFVNAAGANIDVTLPTAASIEGRQYIIKRIDGTATAVSIQTDGSETIDGASSAALTDKRSVVIQSDNSNWWIVAEYISPP